MKQFMKRISRILADFGKWSLREKRRLPARIGMLRAPPTPSIGFKDILMDNFTKEGYNKLDSPYETDLIFHVVLSLIILLIVKKFGWKYLLANFGLTYIKLICTKLFS